MTDSADAPARPEERSRESESADARRGGDRPAERSRCDRRAGRSGPARDAGVERSPEWPFGPTEEERPATEEAPEPPRLGLRARPDVDVAEHPTEITVWVDLPGCEEETVKLSGDEWTLYVAAERSEEYWEDSGIQRRERSRRAERSISLPARCDVDEAEATFEDGVLLVRAPKHESERTQTIGFQ